MTAPTDLRQTLTTALLKGSLAGLVARGMSPSAARRELSNPATPRVALRLAEEAESQLQARDAGRVDALTEDFQLTRKRALLERLEGTIEGLVGRGESPVSAFMEATRHLPRLISGAQNQAEVTLMREVRETIRHVTARAQPLPELLSGMGERLARQREANAAHAPVVAPPSSTWTLS
jgi:hypothetical protein